MIKKGILFWILLVSCLCEDYYKLLGVSKGASDQEIKRAFKKMSLKYHPDKNKKNKEQAKNQFAKIVNAYETLKDKEKRKIYDKHGEEGVRRHAQGQNPDGGANFGGGGFGDFGDFGGFEDFFGGGGGGQHFEFNFGGGGGGNKRRQKFFEEEEEEKKKFFKDNTDIVMIDIGSLRKFYRRDQVWIILLYKPKQQKSIELKETWEELAAKYYGIFQIAAVDCENDAEICEDEFNVHKTPEIQIIKSNLDSEAYIYEDKNMEVNRIAGFAVKFMENYVNYVSDKNFEDFIKQDQERNKVILFTAKKSTPPLLRAISKELKGKLVFGEVRQDQQELLKKFKITKFPTLKVITNPLEYQGVDYEGDYKKDQIMKFLREYAYQTRNQNKKQNSQNKQFVEVDKDKVQQGYLGTTESSLGVILYGRNQDLKYILDKLKDLPNRYKDDPVNFYYINSQKYDLSQVFEYDASKVALIVTKTKRNRYFVFDQNSLLNKNSIQNLLDDVVGGNGRFQFMKATLKDKMKVVEENRKTDL